MMINSPEKQITIFLDPDSYKGKLTIAYAKAHNIPISVQNIIKDPMTKSQLTDIVKRKGLTLDQIADTENPKYLDKFGNKKDFENEDWLSILIKNPELIKNPISLKGKNIMVIETPSDILML